MPPYADAAELMIRCRAARVRGAILFARFAAFRLLSLIDAAIAAIDTLLSMQADIISAFSLILRFSCR